jgi:hypothetical protein
MRPGREAAHHDSEHCRRLRLAGMAFFLCGLGATNHMLMAIHALAIAGFVLALEPGALLRVRARNRSRHGGCRGTL